MKRAEFKRILAGVIAVCMIAALMPETFLFARADGPGGETTVVGFEAAEGSWAEQTVPSGLDQDALVGEGLLYLPSSLTALVLVPGEPQVEPGPGLDGPEIFDGSAGDTGAPAQPEDVPDTVVIAAQVPVTWPTVIDGKSAGVFILEPVISGGYVLGEGVSVPTVTVTVEDAEPDVGTEPDEGAEIAGFEPPESWAAEQTVPLGLGQEALLEYLMLYLPKTVTARIGDETTEISVAWPEDVIGGKETGVFVFEPILPEGYTLGEGVSLPKITVTVVDDEQLFWMLMPQNEASADKQFQISGGSSSTIDAGTPSGRSTYGQGTFNIQGRDGDRTYKTTYGNGGYFVVSSVDGNEIQWKNANATDVSMGSSLTGTVSGEYVYSARYVKITYTVKNTGSTAKDFRIGTYADVMIDNNDYAEVSWITSGGSRTGISMNGAPKNSFKFSALLPDAATMWYGSFASAPRNVFQNYNGDTPYTYDSGMAWSWDGTVPAGGTWSRYVLIGVGELPPAPDPPIIDITADGGLKVKPGDTITITGSGTIGCSAHVSFFGTEYQAEIGGDGKFSIKATVPDEAESGRYTFDYWAVSAEGGVSEFKKANVTVTRLPEIVLSDVVPELTEEQAAPSGDWYKSFIVKSSGTVTHTDVSTDKIGTFTIIYTAREAGYPDAAATLTYKVNPLPPEISMTAPTGKSDTSFAFSGTLDHTGGLTWKEMGFVYGSMQNPSLTFNNGQVRSSVTVQDKGKTFTANATDIVKGVTYYVRPYATASNGTTIYGAQQSFGSGAPQYGTFTITNNGNSTFTVTRTGGTEGTQTVYYRTVNGSAVGGTHFTHQAGTLTFNKGDKSKTITVTENSVTATYGGKPATAYSNADRVYFVEIYRVDGGGTLGTTTRASRTMNIDNGHKVDRKCYEALKEKINKNTEDKIDSSSYKEIFSMQRTFTGYLTYLKETADFYETHMNAFVWEQDDGYEWLRFTSGGQEAIIEFEIDPGGTYKSSTNGWFPRMKGTTENKIYTRDLTGMTPVESQMGLGPVYQFTISTDPIKVAFRATGSGRNKWTLGTCEQESVYYDSKEPQLIGVAPMADTIYKPGDTVTISLIFDEIVDKTNSSLNSGSTITTNWGTFHYVGGADTNVLYYEYTIPENGAAPSGNLQVTSLGTSAGQIKDMCGQSGGTAAGGSGNTSLTVDASVPTITFQTATVSNGTATVPVTVANATEVKYAWTKDTTLPVAWQEWSNTGGGSFQTRQGPGIYYLHILAVNGSSGAQKTGSTRVEIKADGNGGGSMPALEVSVENSSWAQSRVITVSERVPADAVITVTKPDGTTTTLGGGANTFNAFVNGIYKFTINVDGEEISDYASVSMIDGNAPRAEISGSATLTQAENVILTVTLADGVGESGIASYEAKWSGSQTATLIDNGDGTYTATTPGSGDWTLTVKAYDNAGNVSAEARSATYHVVTEGPTIQITKRTSEIKTGVTFEYTVTHPKGIPLVSVQLPSGDLVEVNQTDYAEFSGSFTLTEEADDLYIYATDNLGHITQSAKLNVTKAEAVDLTPPTVRLDSDPFSWTNAGSVTVKVDIYDIGGVASGSWSGTGSGTIGNIHNTSAETGAEGTYAGSFTVTKNGVYTVSVTDGSGNIGSAEIEIDFIDRKNPDVTVSGINGGWTGAAQTVSFTVSDGEDANNKASGIQNFGYAVTDSKSGSAPGKLTSLGIGSGDVTVGGTDNGAFYVYYEVVDNAGNVTAGWTAPIKVDKQAPTLKVSGGMTGAATQTLTVASSFGVSGGTVTVKKPDGSTQTVSGGSCTVTAAGTYEFTATSGSGLTASATAEIYAVSFDGNGAGNPVTQLVASGGKAVEPDDPALDGHAFVEWDTPEGAKYSFGKSASGNVSLKARWTLDAPTVALSAEPMTAPYNNGAAVIVLTANPSHAAGDSVTYTYEWFNDGAKVEGAGGKTYLLKSVDDNGTYKVVVTAKCGHELASEKATSNEVTVSVTAAQPTITAPTVDPLTYGDELRDGLLKGGSASLNGKSVPGTFSWAARGQYLEATEGTAYSVVFTPEDSKNYLPVTFDVTVKVNKKALTPSVAAEHVPGGIYDGTKFSHRSADGEIVLTGAVRGEAPTAHGQVEFVTKDVGTDKPVNVKGITLDDDWGDNYVLSTNYLTDAPSNADVTPKVLTFDWHISEGGKEAVSWDGLYYTGGAYTVTATATNLVSGDECELTMGENGVQTNAGTYTAKITEISNQNYKLPAEITRSYTIKKAPLTPSVAAEQVPGGIYDGTKFSHRSADGEIVLTGAVRGEAPTAHGQVEFVTKDAGKNKTVNVTEIKLDGSWGKNYALTADELTAAHTNAEVTPKELTFEWHFLNAGDKATDVKPGWDGIYYTGESVTVTAKATNLEKGDECELTVGVNGAHTNAGTYTAKITAISNTNYRLPAEITRTYTIKKAPLTPSVAADKVPGGIYDGTKFSHRSADGEIVLTGAVRGEAPTAHGQVEFVTKDVGTDKPVNVKGITLDDDWGDNYVLSTNYLTDAPSNADVTPKVLTFDWHISEGGKEADNWDGLYYTGGEYTVTATATNLVEGDTCELTVGENGEQTSAGTYTAKITEISNNNYALPDDVSREYTIRKAPVTFTVDREVKPDHDWTAELNEDPNPGGYVIDGDTDPDIWNDFALSMTYDSLEHRANVRQNGGLDMGGMFSVSFKRVTDAAGNAVSEDAAEVFRNAGTYEIWVTLTDEPENFMFVGAEPDVRTLRVGTVTVRHYEVRVIWQNLTFVYHGHKMHPTVRVENAFLADEQPDEGEKQGFLKDPATFREDLMAYAATESADAGDYTVTVTLYGGEAGNYTVSNPAASVVIQPAPVVFEVTNNEWLYHEDEEQDRDVALTAAWGEVTNLPDTFLGDGYPGAGTRITLTNLGVTAGDIEYRLENGTAVDNPTGIGTYQVWVRIPNANFRHAGSADGGFHNVGVLRISANEHPATYTVTFDPGRDERGNRFTGVKVPEPMEGLIPTQEINLPPAPENAPAGYVFAGWSRGGALYQPNEDFYMAYSDVTFEARWSKEVYHISGIVTDGNGTALPYVSVALMMGEHQIGLTTTDENGTFRFDGLIPNTYNLVFTWNGVVKTYMVEIVDENVEDGTYVLPGRRLNTVVEVAPGSGSVVVDLDPIITDSEASELYDADERTLDNGGTVEFLMKVENSGAAEGMEEKLKGVPVPADNIGMVLDMSLTKTVTRLNPDGTVESSEVTHIDDSKVLIANLIYLPAGLQGKDSYTVYRFHDEDGDGEEEVQAITTGANSDGEHIEILKNGTAIMVYARYYSTYVLTWYQNPWYSVTVPETPHGAVTPNYPSAIPGSRVTLTVKPAEGYEAGELTVTYGREREIPVTDNGDGTYFFTMPWGNVTVKATFRSKDCDGGEDCPSRRFTDLNVEEWYHRYTDYVIANGLMRGVGGTTFAPDGIATRAQMVTALWILAGGAAVDYQMTYEDVEDGMWYTEAVRWATYEGIVEGYSAARFGPDDLITREQMATMLYHYEQKLGGGGFIDDRKLRLSFADADEVSGWAYEAVAWCGENGVIEARDGNVFDPKGIDRRSMLAAILTRYSY